MGAFFPVAPTYRVDLKSAKGRKVFQVAIRAIGPVIRSPGTGIFNGSENGSARERVVSILAGFKSNDAIPPVKVVRQAAGSQFPYKLTAGVHRLYCSLAVGYTHVPAIDGFDWSTL